MKKRLHILLVFLFFGFGSFAQICDPGVPSFTVDLSSNPDSVWISPYTIRNEYCCGATNPDRCVQFVLTLHPSATAIAFNVHSGAMPPGALFYQIGCGPPTPVGTPICLDGPGPHIITFCKPGNNENQYSITSYGDPGEPADIIVNDGCIGNLSVSGFVESSLTWNSIYPGAPGAYNSYLSCTTACSTTTVQAQAGFPPYIDYQVCGIPLGECSVTPVCRIARVTFNPTLGAQIIPSNPTICFGQTGTTLTAVGSGGTPPYNYTWNTGATGNTIFVGTGTYSVIIGDASGCPPTSASVTVTAFTVPIAANAGPDQIVCKSSPVVQLSGSVAAASGGIWSGGAGSFTPSSSTLNAQYTPTQTELNAGVVNLILTTTGNGTCPPDNDTVRINFVNFQGLISTSINNISCFGLTDGTATVNVSGSVTPYSFTWNTSPVQTGATASNLGVGTYTVNIIDGNGCPASTSISITQPPPLSVGLTSTNVSCFGGGNGTATASASGGTPPYTYSWSNGGTNSSATGLTAGTYTVGVTDSRGCTRSASVTITQPPLLNAAIGSSTNVSCFGGNNGSASATATGGTPGYTYSWSTGATSNSISGLTAGTYTVTVTDLMGCQDPASVIITQPAAALSGTTSQTNVSCAGGNDGSASVNASGGTAPYTYSWSSGSTASNANNLAAGNYTVLITDANGCQLLIGVTITQPPTLLVNLTPVNTTCDLPNGQVISSVSGGTLPYTYSWSTGATTPSITGLPAGGYSITVTDANGCSKSASVTIINSTPQIIPFIASVTNVSCFGGADGSATISISGGTSPFTYSWSPIGGSNATATDLSAGTYTVSITDANSCSASIQVTIGQPSSLPSVTTTVVNNVSCYGGSNGSLSAQATGGTTPYSYSWTPAGGTAPVASNLPTGTYTITVTDDNGCTAAATGYISQPVPMSVTTAATAVSCNGGSNGTISATASGGTSPYSFNWQPGNISGPVANNLSAGTYTLTVTDANGCTSVVNAIVTQPAPLALNIIKSDVVCNGGSNGNATAMVSGGTSPYIYSWNPTGTTTANITALLPGTYTVNITDARGCTIQGSTIITQPPPITVTVTSVNVLCRNANNGSASVVASGGTPGYTYTWSTGSTGTSVTNLPPGTHYVVVRDSKNCTKLTNFTITQPASFVSGTFVKTNVSCNGGSDGTATVTGTGGTPGYTYSWNSLGTTGPVATGLSAGTFSVTITDANGCQAIRTVVITEPTLLTVTVNTTPVSCFGGNNGSASAVVSGGTPGYTYTWSNGASTANVSGLSAGNYTVVVRDNKGCTQTVNFTIAEPSGPLSASLSATAVSCYGGNDGSILAIVSGGTPAYTFSWSPGGYTTANPTGLTAGNYTVLVRDSKNCFTTATVAVGEPAPISVTVSATNATCGLANAIATATVSGGTAPYTYSWSPGSNTSTQGGLASGSYNVTVTDNAGCETVVPFNVSNLAGPNAVILSITNVSCYGGSDGSATVSHTGGTGPFSYSWNSVPPQTTSTAVNLPAGLYTVTVTDANGCQGVVSTNPEITQPDSLSVSLASTPVSCFGGNDGAAAAVVSGGTSPYTYNWSSGSAGPSAGGLSAGTHTLTVTDANGCGLIRSVVVTQPTPLSAVVFTSDVNCFGGNDGSVTVSPSGGTAPYTYSWSTGVTSPTFADAAAGTYTVVTTDSKGCSISTPAIVGQPGAALNSTFTINNVGCNGASTGQIIANVSGGTTPYSYSWSNGGPNANVISGIPAGSYSLLVTDNLGCEASFNIQVTQPDPIGIVISEVKNISCFGGSDGYAVATAIGGSGNLTYSWSSGTTDSIATGLSAGTYTVLVADNNGCSVTLSVTLTQPSSSLTVSTTQTNVPCKGNLNGSATAIAAGGTAPYNYTWSPGNHYSPTYSNLAAGTYSVLVVDNNQCTATTQVIITEPLVVLSASVSVTPVSCSGGTNGIATANGAGGTSPYSYSWSTGATTQTLTGATSGTYQVTVTDQNGCQATASGNIAQPSALVISVSTTNVTCYGTNTGSATATVTGGQGTYTYSWSAGVGSGSTRNGLPAGGHTVSVTDGNGCQAFATFNITQPSVLSVAISSVNPSCNGSTDGSISLTVSGGTPGYSYSWFQAGVSGANPTNLASGTYNVIITDNNGCTVTRAISLTAPVSLTSSITSANVKCFGGSDAFALGTASGGTQPYTYSWSNGTPGQSISNVAAGTYTFTITDSKGCTLTTPVVISQPSAALNANVSSTNVSCNGGNNGTAIATPSGGTPPYSYSWSPSGNQTPGESNLSAGTYVVFIRDANQCNTSANVQITEPQPLTILVTSQENSYCGQNNGYINVSSGGGTTPYSITWSNGATGNQASNLPAGTYTATVTDQNGCVAMVSATISEVNAGAASIGSFSNVSCYGGSNGTATVVMTGGTAPFSYVWSPYGGNNASATNLTSGTYTVTALDSKGCSATASVTITQPTELVATVPAKSNALCYNTATGTATAFASGGTAPYSYSWQTSPVQFTAQATGLSAGTYVVTITDANGCKDNNSVSITQPPLLTGLVSSTNATCSGTSTGTATAVYGGGTPPYSYSWNSSPVQSTSIATGLPAGTYNVTVTDANGCSETRPVVITQPSQVITSSSPDVTICRGTSTTIFASATGGSSNYYYLWNNGLGAGASHSVSPQQTTTYIVTAYDQNGCAGTTDSVKVSVTSLLPENLIVQAFEPICPGSSTTVYASVINSAGGTLTYSWSHGLGPGPGAFTVFPSGPTTYVVTVTNNCGASVTDSVAVQFRPLPQVSFTMNDNEGCEPFIVNFSDLTNTSEAVAAWFWDFGDGTGSTSSNPVHTYENSGTYTPSLTVVTTGGCRSTFANSGNQIIVHEGPTAGFSLRPPIISIPGDPLILTNQSSSGAISFDWSFGDGSTSTLANPTHNYTNVGEYQVTLTATDQFGCIDTSVREVLVIADLVFPNAFTPNAEGPGDGSYDMYDLDNDVFHPFTAGVEEFRMMIFNRWGELIFETNNLMVGWNGYYRGVLCEQGVYVFKAYVKMHDGTILEKVGDVTLLR